MRYLGYAKKFSIAEPKADRATNIGTTVAKLPSDLLANS